MKHQRLMMAGLLLGGVSLAGCMKDKDSGPSASTTKPAVAAAPAKEMTHYLTVDQPCYMSPGGDKCGTLAKGTKVLLLIPGSMAQIETADGKTLYTKIDGIESIETPPPVKPGTPTPAPKPTPPAPVVAPKPAEVKPATPAKEMTHMLTAEQPYYTAMPMSADAKPAGKLAKGTKVLLLIPGSYCQVETADGKTVYTKIDGVDLIPAK